MSNVFDNMINVHIFFKKKICMVGDIIKKIIIIITRLVAGHIFCVSEIIILNKS